MNKYKPIFVFLLVSFFFLLIPLQTVQANDDIVVRCSTVDMTIANGDVTGLINAITAANTESCYPGEDTIVLASNGLYTLYTPNVDDLQGATGLPNIVTDIKITGNGATIMRSTGLTVPNFRIFNVNGGKLTLDNLTVSNGSLNPVGVTPGDGSPKDNGGGIVVYDAGTLILNGVTVENNQASDSGGGVHNSLNTTLTINNSTIRNNIAGEGGGGLTTASGAVTKINSTTFDNNEAKLGGNIHHLGGSLILKDSLVMNGTSTTDGGGFHNNSTLSEIINTEFKGNNAGDRGGGIFNASTMTITGAYIHDNETTVNGGGIDNTTGATTYVRQSSIIKNLAGVGGGGIGSNGVLTITNTTISGNSAPIGEQLYHSTNATTNIEFSTLVGNANVIYLDSNTLTTKASILSANGSVCANNTISSAGFNYVTDTSCGSLGANDVVTTNPGLSPLTVSDLPAYHLEATSPAIDVIPESNCTWDHDHNSGTIAQPLLEDQLSNTRPAKTRCDAGAVESVLSVQLVSSAVTINESTGGNGGLQLSVSGRPIATGQPVTLTITDGETNSTDYSQASATMTIPAGNYDTAQLINVPTTAFAVLNDNVVESDETLTLTISSSVANLNISNSANTATVTITDDDSAVVTVENVSVNEGDSGTVAMTFTATVDNAVQGGFTVNYATSNNTATAGDDYTGASGTLTFAGNAGETQSFAISVRGETNIENDETFTVTLSSPSNSNITANDTATGIIINDDEAIETLTDGGFEGEKSKGVPVAWSGKLTTIVPKDKQKCNKPEKDKYISRSGDCAFMFKGNPTGEKSKINQKIENLSVFTNGALVNFSVYVDKRSGKVGHPIAKLIVKYSNGDKDKLLLRIPDAEGYTPISGSVVIDLTGRNLELVKVQFRNKLTSGKFFIDDASLTVTPAIMFRTEREALPLPEAPGSFRD